MRFGITVEEADPVQLFDLREAFEQQRQAVAQAEVFAVKGGVLSDEGDFADARGGQVRGFARDRLQPPAAEFSAQLRDDAEGAGMVAALIDLDVGGVARRREDARRLVLVEIRDRVARFRIFRALAEVAAARRQDLLDFAGADHGVDFGNLRANLFAVTFGQAAGDDEFLGAAEFLVLGHFEDGFDRFLLRRGDEAAGVDDEDVGFIGPPRDFVAGARQNAHHHLAVDEVLGAAQADKSGFRGRRAVFCFCGHRQ